MKIMKTKAYSLVELVLVLAIMSILISAISLKAEVIENYKAKNQIKKLVLDLNYVRNFAQKTNTRTSLIIGNEGYFFFFFLEKEEVKFSKLIEIINTNLDTVSFTNLGKPAFLNGSSTSGHIIFKIKNKTMGITIAPVSGKVTYYDNYNYDEKD